MIQCKKCGEENKDDAKHCNDCGKKLVGMFGKKTKPTKVITARMPDKKDVPDIPKYDEDMKPEEEILPDEQDIEEEETQEEAEEEGIEEDEDGDLIYATKQIEELKEEHIKLRELIEKNSAEIKWIADNLVNISSAYNQEKNEKLIKSKV